MSMPVSDSSNVYSNSDLVSQMEALIQQIEKGLKEGKDQTDQIAQVMNDIQGFQGNLVGQSSQTEQAQNIMTAGVANLQAYGADKSGAPMQLVNQWTGEKETNADGTPLMGSPEAGAAAESQFLSNCPYTPYLLNSQGQSTGVKNPLYGFTQSNLTQQQSVSSAVEGVFTSLSGGSDFPVTVTGTPGYVIGSDGNVVPGSGVVVSIQGDDASPDASGNYTSGCITNMWSQGTPSTSGEGNTSPNSAILNNFQTSMGTLGQSVTASSSLLQSDIKVLTTNYQAGTTNYSNFLQDILKLLQNAVSAQKQQ